MKQHRRTFPKGHPPGHPLHGYPGPDPKSVALCIPIGDFKPDIECVYGMMRCAPFYSEIVDYCGCSMVNEARNRIAHKFMNRCVNHDWAVWVDSDIGFTPEDWCYLVEGNDPLVVGPYSKKNFDGTRVETGFGFVKVHRKVFQAITDLLDDEGRDRAPRFFLDGDMMIDYFSCGASGDAQWLGEDDGFFAWAALAGYPPRVETRVNLTHFGRCGYRLRAT